MIRVALYVRYSSHHQREAPVEDQFRLCRQHADKEGWSVVKIYLDLLRKSGERCGRLIHHLIFDRAFIAAC